MRLSVKILIIGIIVISNTVFGENLIKNGGFEQIQAGAEFPEHWTEKHHQYKPLQIAPRHYQGKIAAMVVGDGQQYMWRQKIKAPKGHAFNLSAFVRADNAKYKSKDDSVQVYLHIVYKDRPYSDTKHIYKKFDDGGYDWIKYEVSGMANVDYEIDHLLVSVMGKISSGFMFIDKLELIESEESGPVALLRRKVNDLAENLKRILTADSSVEQALANCDKSLEYLKISDIEQAKKYWVQAAKSVSHDAWAKMFPDAMSDKKIEAQMLYHAQGSTPAETDHYISILEQAGCNGVYLSLGSWAEVTYKSKYIPRYSEYGDFDPLAYVIKQCHKRGINVFAYLAVFHGTFSPVAENGNIYQMHPEWFAGDPSRNIPYFPDPANEEASAWAAKVYTELVTNYDLDGIGLDYIRYPTPKALNYDENNRKQIFARFDIDITKNNPYEDQKKWSKIQVYRMEKVSHVVKTVRDAVKKAKPDSPIIACLISDPVNAAWNYGQNWSDSSPLLEYASPMNYDSVSLDELLVGRQRDIFQIKKARFIPAIGGMPQLHQKWTISEWAKTVAIQRKIGCDGIIIYRMGGFDPAVAAFFGNGPFYNNTAFPEPISK